MSASTIQSLFDQLKIHNRHPQTGEYVLIYDEISAVLQHIAQTGCAVILGGDVLDAQMQHLHLNWYYQPDFSLSPTQNARQSCDAALHYIQHLPDHTKYCYIPVFDAIVGNHLPYNNRRKDIST